MKSMKLIKNLKIKIIHYHRKPERTFKIREKYFPICICCAAIYVGTIFTISFHYFITIEYNTIIFLISLCPIILMDADVASQISKCREGHNSIRFIIGFIGGVGYSLMLLMIFLSVQKILVKVL